MKIFEEETTSEAREIPYFEDVKGSAGYTGHETGKSDRELLSLIGLALGRMDAQMTGYVKIRSEDGRTGYRVRFNYGGQPGKIDVLGLPLRTVSLKRGFETLQSKAVRMALYNLERQLTTMWQMEQFVPGFFALLPMMLVDGNVTIGEVFAEQMNVQHLLPAPATDDYVDCDFTITEE